MYTVVHFDYPGRFTFLVSPVVLRDISISFRPVCTPSLLIVHYCTTVVRHLTRVCGIDSTAPSRAIIFVTIHARDLFAEPCVAIEGPAAADAMVYPD